MKRVDEVEIICAHCKETIKGLKYYNEAGVFIATVGYYPICGNNVCDACAATRYDPGSDLRGAVKEEIKRLAILENCPSCTAKDASYTKLEEAKKDLAEREFQRGFREGESKQAILEIQGRDKFLADVKLRQEDIYEYRMKLRTAESRLALLEKVAEYAVHKDGCGYTFDHITQTGELSSDCTCGLRAALDAAKEGK